MMMAVFCLVLFTILFLAALCIVSLTCWLSGMAFDWGAVALVWLVLLVASIFLGDDE